MSERKQWCELYSNELEPMDHQIKEFVNNPLWDDLTNHLQQTYNIKPQLFYSGCSMDKGYWKGWNVKYKKGSKALCTLYPKQGYILMLLPLGLKEISQVDTSNLLRDRYMQNLFKQTIPGKTGMSLPVEVKSSKTLQDVKKLIALRYDTR